MKHLELAKLIGLEIGVLKPAVEDYLKYLFEEDMTCNCPNPHHRYIPKDKDDWDAVNNFICMCSKVMQSIMMETDEYFGKAICDSNWLKTGDNTTKMQSKMLQKSTLSAVLIAHTQHLRSGKPPCGADEYYDHLRADVLKAVDRQIKDALVQQVGGGVLEEIEKLLGVKGKSIAPGIVAFEFPMPDKKDLN